MPGQQLTLDIQAKDVEGLIFGVDRKQVDKAHVLTGKNFLLNAKGPFAAWGRRLASNVAIPNSGYVQSFETSSGNSLIFTRNAIYKYNNAADIFFPIYSFTPQTDLYMWSSASPIIGGKHYFCRKGVGVLQYTETTNAITLLNDMSIPVNPLSVANVRGRLLILGTAAYAWSALDNGTNLTPSLSTGAGIQALAIIGGTAFKIVPLNDAFLVFTSAGIVVGEFSGGQAVFRHRVLTTKFKAVNALCIQELDTGVAIFLDEVGLHISDGREPEEFQPLFNEFLRTELFIQIKSENFANYRLCARCPNILFKVMVSTTGEDEIYEIAYILYRPVNKFGTLDDRFHSFIQLPITTGTRIQLKNCIVDPDGYLKELTGENFVEQRVIPSDAFFWRTDFDWPASIVNGTYVFPTLMTMESEKIWIYKDLATGWYTTQEILEAKSFTP